MISTILTVEDARRTREKLNNIQENIFSTNYNLEKSLDSFLSQEEKQEFKSFFSQNNLNLKTPKEINLGIEKIQESIDKMPLVILTTAFKPTVSSIRKFSNLLSERNKERVLLSLNVNPQILGGVLIELNGNFRDYSLNAPKT